VEGLTEQRTRHGGAGKRRAKARHEERKNGPIGEVHTLPQVLTSFEPCSPPTPQARPREPARRQRQKQKRRVHSEDGRERLPQFQAQVPHPTSPRFEQTAFPQGVCEYQRSDSCSSSSSASTVSARAALEVQIQHIRGGKRWGGKGADKELVDDPVPLDADARREEDVARIP
jgi:hypothetical protein